MTDARCGMRIGTDAVLLGAWTAAGKDVRHIADIGAGCGIIALMLAQRAADARITAVECDPGACSDARTNIASSPWSHRISVAECRFEEYKPAERLDLIVSNPPFFTEQLHSPDKTRAIARHAGELSFAALASRAEELLTPDGRIAVVLPAGDDDDTILTAALNRLHPARHCHVADRTGRPPKRSLWEFSLEEYACTYSTLVIRDDSGNFSPDYIKLGQPYHINL